MNKWLKSGRILGAPKLHAIPIRNVSANSQCISIHHFHLCPKSLSLDHLSMWRSAFHGNRMQCHEPDPCGLRLLESGWTFLSAIQVITVLKLQIIKIIEINFVENTKKLNNLSKIGSIGILNRFKIACLLRERKPKWKCKNKFFCQDLIGMANFYYCKRAFN